MKLTLAVTASFMLIFSVIASSPKDMTNLEKLAPFAKGETASDVKQFVPKVVGNSIVSGNKTLAIRKNGKLNLLIGNKTIQFTPGFMTTAGWMDLGRYNNGKIKYDPKTKTFEFNVKLTKLHNAKRAEVSLIEKISLLDDGLIKIDFSCSGHDIKEFKGVYISWPDSEAGKKLLFKGKEYTIDSAANLGRKYPWILSVKERAPIDLFINSPAEEFKLIPETFKSLMVSSEVIGKKRCLRVSISPGENSHELSFLLDLRSGVEVKPSQYSIGGVDFMAVEAMETPDYASSRNLIKNPSFERGFHNVYAFGFNTNRYFPGKDRWDRKYVEIDDTEGKFGGSSLKLNTWNDHAKWRKGGPQPVMLQMGPVPAEPGVYTLSFYAKGDRPGSQKIICGKSINPTDQWQRYSHTFKVNKREPYSIKFFASSTTCDGSVWLDGIQLEKGDKVTEFTQAPVSGKLLTSAEDNFLENGDAINARLKINAAPGVSGKARVSVKNFFSEKLFDQTFDFKCDANGDALVPLAFEKQFPRGIYVFKAEYELPTGEKSYDLSRFAIVDSLENKHRLKNMFNVAYSNPVGIPNTLKRLERFKRIGAGSVGRATTWRKDSFELLKRFGIDMMDTTMLGGMGNTRIHPEYKLPVGHMFKVTTQGPRTDNYCRLKDFRVGDRNAKLTDEYLEKFKEAVTENARKSPWVNVWLMNGESIDGSAIGLDHDSYIKLAIAFNEAVKAANPNAKVATTGPCNMRPLGGIKEIDELLAAIDGKVKYDAINCHCYRARPEDPDLDSNIATLLKTLDKHGYKDTPVIFDEGTQWGPYTIPQWNKISGTWGAARCWFQGALSYDIGWNEKISAAWRARAWIMALKYQDRVKTLCQADMVNNCELDLGLTPRVTQKIPSTLGRLLGDAVFKKDIRFAPYTRCYIFEDKQGRPVAAVWGYHQKLDDGEMKPFVASANFNGSTPEIFDLMEAEREARPNGKGDIQFPVSSFPLFFRGEPGETDAFVKAFTNASLVSSSLPPVIVTGQPSSPDNLKLNINNLLSRPFAGKISVNGGDAKNVNVPASETGDVIAPLPEKLQNNEIQKERIQIAIVDAATGNKFMTNANFDGFFCGKVKNPIVIDGDLDDWRSIPSVPLKTRFTHGKDKGLKISDEDFSGWFKIAWSDKGLYLCVNIIDDTFRHDEQVERHKANLLHNRWNNDSLQVYFDTLCNARRHETRGYDTDDYDYAVFSNAAGDNAISYRYRTPDMQLTLGMAAPKDGTLAPEIPAAIKRVAKGYRYEVFYPNNYLLPFKPEKGAIIGFGLTVNDRDEDKGVESSLSLSNQGRGCFNCPHTWPVMLLWE